jgi:hypothetical protein
MAITDRTHTVHTGDTTAAGNWMAIRIPRAVCSYRATTVERLRRGVRYLSGARALSQPMAVARTTSWHALWQIKRARGRCAMSVYGTKQTSISTLNMSAFGGKADISDRLADVR